jgi:GDP/UDP-N,N'-diacetylbacillosamine 2-epimerase (hydrolysing)
VKSLGLLIQSLADVLATARPDWIVLAGDRPEQMAGALAGAFCYIPVAHIQAGEVSGNIDGMTRHAIGKYVHMHLAANEDAAQRLVRLGEEPFRVHQVGAPQLDELTEGRYTDADSIA